MGMTEVAARGGDQDREVFDELQRIKQQMRGAIPPGTDELIKKLAAGALGQPFPGQRWPQQVAAEVLELLSGVSGQCDIGM